MLVISKRSTERIEAYSQGTHTVAALILYRASGIEKSPGQDVRYVVVDDDAKPLLERVQLPFEAVRVGTMPSSTRRNWCGRARASSG